jgi:chemotaxis response regulator CheB
MVLNPIDAKFDTMPNAVIKATAVDYVASLKDIISLLLSVDEKA